MLPVWDFAVFRVINQKKTASDITKPISHMLNDWQLVDSEISNQFALFYELIFVQEH